MKCKKCSHCSQVKELYFFTVDKRFMLGIKSTCDECIENMKRKTKKFKGSTKSKWITIDKKRRDSRLISDAKELLKKQGYDTSDNTISLKAQQLSTYRLLKKLKNYVKEKTTSASK